MAIPWRDSNIATVQFAQLPLSERVVGLQIVAVQDNTSTVRVSWEALTSTFLHTADANPGEPSSAGDTLECWVSEDGFYTWESGMWGKSPRMQAHWEDTVRSASGDYVRFLVVHKDQALTSAEKQQALRNIGLTVASDELGLVREDVSVFDKAPVHIDDTGALSVPQATTESYGAARLLRYTAVDDIPEAAASALDNDVVPYKYFSDMWAALPLYSLPPATYTSLGGIVPYTADFDMDPEPDNPEETLLPGTMRARRASYTQYGYVKKMDMQEWSAWYEGDAEYKRQNPIDTTAVPEYSLLHALADTLRIYSATEGTYGTIRLSPMVTTDGEGGLTVRAATFADPGVVKTIGSFSAWKESWSEWIDTQDVVPSVYAVSDYVSKTLEKAFAGFSATEDASGNWNVTIPHASQEAAGIVRLSDQFHVGAMRDGATVYSALFPVKASRDITVGEGSAMSLKSGTVYVNHSYATVPVLPAQSDYDCLVPSFSAMRQGDQSLAETISGALSAVNQIQEWRDYVNRTLYSQEEDIDKVKTDISSLKYQVDELRKQIEDLREEIEHLVKNSHL